MRTVLHKIFLLSMVAITATSCAHVWVTQRGGNGGTIAYKGDPNSSSFKDKYSAAVNNICGGSGYRVVNQQQRSNSGQYTYNQTQNQTANGYGTYGQPVGSVQYQTTTPVTQTYTEYWWEDSIECLGH